MRFFRPNRAGWGALLLGWPQWVHACAVCFGKSDNADLPRAFIWGGAVLLGSTFFILVWLAVAIYRIEKRLKKADETMR
ncbi:MAG: hypothetical protein HY551_01375 [Elusimicrobia bacterium]|nr:hypothetical protein [Elusimicrobiota bacterium]